MRRSSQVEESILGGLSVELGSGMNRNKNGDPEQKGNAPIKICVMLLGRIGEF